MLVYEKNGFSYIFENRVPVLITLLTFEPINEYTMRRAITIRL